MYLFDIWVVFAFEARLFSPREGCCYLMCWCGGVVINRYPIFDASPVPVLASSVDLWMCSLICFHWFGLGNVSSVYLMIHIRREIVTMRKVTYSLSGMEAEMNRKGGAAIRHRLRCGQRVRIGRVRPALWISWTRTGT